MAKGRRAANLAGLAALGALGYSLYSQNKAKAGSGPTNTGTASRQSQAAAEEPEAVEAYPDESLRGRMTSAPETIPARRAAQMDAAAPVAPAAVQNAAVSEEMRGRGYNRAPAPPVIGPRSTGRGGATAAELEAYERSQRAEAQRGRGYNRADAAKNEAMRGRGYNRADAPSTTRPAARTAPMTREERIAQIPTGGTPTVSGGERVSGNEFTRNLSNTLNATAGLSAPGFVGNMTQKQYNALAALRRQEEGLSAAEAAAARQAAREAKTLNPMAWMAGPKGMSENFKKGGAVKAKKMSSGGSSSASQRGDGIASRGKTKCKMY